MLKKSFGSLSKIRQA
jgi:methionyl aminopeptidase